MKTKLLLIALAFGLMSSTCTPEDQPQNENTCQCKKVYYELQITGWAQGGVQPVWSYVKIGEEQATEMDCNSATSEYQQEGSNLFYLIECE
jgi:hypothetical protein